MKKLHTFKLSETYSIIVFDNNSPSNYNRFITLVDNVDKKSFLHGTTCKTMDKSGYKLLGLSLKHSWEKRLPLNSFPLTLIKNAFDRCYGLREAIQNEKTRNDGLIALGQQTNLKLTFLGIHLENILKL